MKHITLQEIDPNRLAEMDRYIASGYGCGYGSGYGSDGNGDGNGYDNGCGDG
jgi:hypothetical protein